MAPTPNARRSVTDVMVIDIPLVLSMLFILSSIDAFDRDGAPAIPDIRINMSSILLKSIQHSTLSYVGKRGLQNDFECMIKLALPIIKKGLTPTIFVNFKPIALTKSNAAPIPKTGVMTPAIP